MRLRWVLLAIGAAGAAGLFACFDLFHTTSDLLTACEIDAQTPGCVPEGGPGQASPTDFCRWTPSEAAQSARRACAWLGACETPMGRNAFGPCMFQALLAYDCNANPNHPVEGEARTLWDCLWKVKTCGDVDACIFPKRLVCGTGGDFIACADSTDSDAGNGDVRIECIDGGQLPYPKANGENCALWGQTCAASASPAACAGGAGAACTVSGCSGTELHWCVGQVDVGLDCASTGTQDCETPAARGDAGWFACAPRSDAGACVADPSGTCEDGVASSCPAGTREQIDCDEILQTEGGCTPGPLSPPFDWTSPCAVVPPACAHDSCVDSGLVGCERGASYALGDCASEGLGPCVMVSTDLGTAEHAACAAP